MRLPRPLWTIASALLLLASLAFADPLDDVDKTAREWVKLRVETTRLETAWLSERTLVESTAAALNERAGLLEEKRDLAKIKTAKEREEIETLRAKNRQAAEDLKMLDARLKTLTEKLVTLRPNLPPRLSDALAMSYRSLADPALPAGERLQIAINVLNRCAQFNRIVTSGEDALTLDNGQSVKSLETLYWGLSHGYAIDRKSRKAWLGSPGSGGWRWEPAAGAYEQIVQLISIAQDQADPALVAVPIGSTKSVSDIVRH